MIEKFLRKFIFKDPDWHGDVKMAVSGSFELDELVNIWKIKNQDFYLTSTRVDYGVIAEPLRKINRNMSLANHETVRRMIKNCLMYCGRPGSAGDMMFSCFGYFTKINSNLSIDDWEETGMIFSDLLATEYIRNCEIITKSRERS